MQPFRFPFKPQKREKDLEQLPLYIEKPLPPLPRAPKEPEKEERGVIVIEIL